MVKESHTGRRIHKSIGNYYGWIRDLKRGEVKFDKPVVLCLSGDGTQDDNTANGMAKEVEEILGRYGVVDNDIQILSVQYPKKTFYENQYSMERRSFAKNHTDDSDEVRNPEYIKDIYTAVLQPLIINSKGRRIPFYEAQKKFRNLTLFSHCHGTFVACKLMNYLSEEMKKYGYNNQEINLLCSEIVNIGISPRAGFHRTDGSLKFGFTMLDDALASYLYPILTENAGKGCVKSNLTLGMENSENSYMYFSGDNLKYTNIDEASFYLLESEFMHGVKCYTDCAYTYISEDKKRLNKNAVGINFSRLIIRIFQNAVSLSKQGIKRTVDNIVSNKTPITFKQGNKYDNYGFIGVEFEGNNASFEKTLIDYRKYALEKRFDKASQKLETEESDNILIHVLNKSDEK